jgi:hypothetical protein
MAGKSKNKYDVYTWIKDKVIPSCITPIHIVVCNKIISNFDKTYDDYPLTKALRLYRNDHFDSMEIKHLK